MNYKEKYLKYKFKYKNLKKQLVGGASLVRSNDINFSNNNFYKNGIKLNKEGQIRQSELSGFNYDEAYFLRKNRSLLKNNLSIVKDKTNFEYGMDDDMGKRIDLQKYTFFYYNDNRPVESLDNTKKVITTDFVIIGAGPVGLLTGIKTLLTLGKSVAIVEIRENNTRNEIFMLQQNDKFNSISYLNQVSVYQEALQHGCWVSPPNVFAADCQKSTRDDENKRLAIRIKDLQFILEKKFIELGGIIVRPSTNKKLEYNIVRSGSIGKTIYFRSINNSVLSRESISIFPHFELKWREILIGADGVGSNTRRNYFKRNPNPKLTYYYFSKHVNKMVNDMHLDDRLNFETKNDVYGMVIHLKLDADVYRQIRNTTKSEPQINFRLFIPNVNSVNNKAYAGIQISKEYYSELAFKIQEAKSNPSDKSLQKIIDNSTISSEDSASNESLILNFDDMKLNRDALQIDFLREIVVKISECLVHYGMRFSPENNLDKVLGMIHQVKIN